MAQESHTFGIYFKTIVTHEAQVVINATGRLEAE